jgi:glucosamine--fructose-6-phosphate aminotransferase (isomerizing)
MRRMAGELMEAEIREQPKVLAENAQRYEQEFRQRLVGKRFEVALLVARGSSDNAALYARYLIEINLGIPTFLAAPSVFTRYKAKVRYPPCLAIGISQSGAAPDVAEVLSALRKDGHTTLGITNTPGSLISEAAEFTLDLGAGPEKSVAATKTYTSTLLALYQLVRALGAELPDPQTHLPDDKWLEISRAAAEGAVFPVDRSRIVFALARGYDFCTALETGLKLMECALIPAKSFSTADFQHGPLALAGPGTVAIVYGGEAQGLEKQGCTEIDAPTPIASVPDPLRPIGDTFFAQWLALLCARARFLDPDNPQHIRKVTETL